MDTANEKNITPIIRSFKEAESKSLLNLHEKYHYTSPDAFLSIITKKNLRFTDARFMNDKSELIYFVKILLEFLQSSKTKYPLCLECLNNILAAYEVDKIKKLEIDRIDLIPNIKDISDQNITAKRTYIFCTSTDADSLSMWNYYVKGGNYQGYNIGFNINKLLKQFEHIRIGNANVHSAAPNGSWCGDQRQLSAANGTLN